MDVANSHPEKIASTAQNNGCKMQCHYMLMEGLVGQQQMLLSRLVEIMSAAGSEGSKEVIKDQKEPQKMQGGELGGQEEIQVILGGVLGDKLEDVLGNELENGTGVKDSAGGNGQEKDKGKQKAI
ncbi:hypothetical protein ID866_10039 [Astraeus odoratus]|nr:hypothetical protein ID866_10039 [Astraeus odoratus]